MKTSTAGLTQQIRQLLATIHAQNPRATARRIELEEAADIARAVRATIRAASPDDEDIVVRVYGGFVPNSARFGDADYISILVKLGTDYRTMGGHRGPATRRKHGQGDTIIGRARKPGQTHGRIVHTR